MQEKIKTITLNQETHNYRCALEPGFYYHIYNRGNNSGQLFFKKENYRFFIMRYKEAVLPFADTLAYCLLPNHFHFLVKVREGGRDVSHSAVLKSGLNAKHLSGGLQRLFTGYAKAINKQESRHGSLFEKPFRRIKITSNDYLQQLTIYIHNNPVKHGYVLNPGDWEFSSYNKLVSGNYDWLKGNETIELFDNVENFKYVHENKADILNELILED